MEVIHTARVLDDVREATWLEELWKSKKSFIRAQIVVYVQLRLGHVDELRVAIPQVMMQDMAPLVHRSIRDQCIVQSALRCSKILLDLFACKLEAMNVRRLGQLCYLLEGGILPLVNDEAEFRD